jgi:arylsulfatase
MPKNIVLIFTDQQRFDTIEALGNPIIKTPNLNRLVDKGVAFTRAYTPCPVCIPARYALHTGILPCISDCVMNETMPEGHESFMEILSRHGYQTHGVGKMHFEFDDKTPDYLWGYASRDVSEECVIADDYTAFLRKNGYDHVHDPHGVRSEMYYIPQPSQVPARLHNSSWVVDKSIDFLNKRDTSKPFMLMTSFIKPHPPFESPTPWNKLYRGPQMPLPKRPQDTENLLTYWNKVQNRYKYKDQGSDDHLARTIKASYYGAISFIDYNVGRLLDYLELHHLFDDTIIVFSSDHGELLGDYDSYGKRTLLDSAVRIPLVMVHPDVSGGTICNTPVSLIDIMPTFLDAAGIERSEALDGDSLLDLCSNPKNRDCVYSQYQRNEYGLYMMVTEQFKYIYSAPDQKEWLFDLVTDPDETRNKALNPMFIHQTIAMREQLISFLADNGCADIIDAKKFKKYPKKDFNVDSDAMLLFQDPPDSLPHIPGYERSSVYTEIDIFGRNK